MTIIKEGLQTLANLALENAGIFSGRRKVPAISQQLQAVQEAASALSAYEAMKGKPGADKLKVDALIKASTNILIIIRVCGELGLDELPEIVEMMALQGS